MIYITIPVHNEQRTIGVLLWRIREIFTELGRDFRILVLDDGSTDDTADVLEPYTRVLPLTVLRHEARKGYAASLDTLIREVVRRSEYPRRDGVLVMQGDFTDGPEAIADILRRFQGGADLVTVAAVGVKRAPWPVRLARMSAAAMLRGLRLPEQTGDAFTGYRLYRLMVLKRTLKDIPKGKSLIRNDGWAASVELLAAVGPHVRQAAVVDAPYDTDRRYRDSRFKPVPELWALHKLRRDPRIRASAAQLSAN
ncbi:MAG: glycosyltransferase family 2 protein [Gemmatimonadota bacterium]